MYYKRKCRHVIKNSQELRTSSYIANARLLAAKNLIMHKKIVPSRNKRNCDVLVQYYYRKHNYVS